MENRIIKFRAWDKKLKQWFFMEFKGRQVIFTTPGITKDESSSSSDLDEHWYQFTGLHDKNEKEIYEGDLIIQQDYKKPLEVYFCDDCGCFKARLHGKGNIESIHGDCEVIGNIFENPELIK